MGRTGEMSQQSVQTNALHHCRASIPWGDENGWATVRRDSYGARSHAAE